jgi:hypothetical protein
MRLVCCSARSLGGKKVSVGGVVTWIPLLRRPIHSWAATLMATSKNGVRRLFLPIVAFAAGLYLVYRNIASRQWFEVAFEANRQVAAYQGLAAGGRSRWAEK